MHEVEEKMLAPVPKFPLPPRLVLLLLGVTVALRVLVQREEAALNAGRVGVGAVVAALGIFLTLAGARHFSRRRANIVTFNAPTELVVDGLFSVSRNPMYLGFALLLGGVALALGGILTFLPTLLFVVAAEKIYIPFEEQAMRRVFGEPYVQYTGRVRRWFGRRASHRSPLRA